MVSADAAGTATRHAAAHATTSFRLRAMRAPSLPGASRPRGTALFQFWPGSQGSARDFTGFSTRALECRRVRPQPDQPRRAGHRLGHRGLRRLVRRAGRGGRARRGQGVRDVAAGVHRRVAARGDRRAGCGRRGGRGAGAGAAAGLAQPGLRAGMAPILRGSRRRGRGSRSWSSTSRPPWPAPTTIRTAARQAFLATGVSVFVLWNLGHPGGRAGRRGPGRPARPRPGRDVPGRVPGAAGAAAAAAGRAPAAVAGAVLAVALLPVAPAGVPVLAAALGVVPGVLAARRAEAA